MSTFESSVLYNPAMGQRFVPYWQSPYSQIVSPAVFEDEVSEAFAKKGVDEMVAVENEVAIHLAVD